MKLHKLIKQAAVLGLISYLIFVFFMIINGKEFFWSSLALPVILIIGFRKQDYAGWLILFTNLSIESLFYCFIALRGYLFIHMQLADSSTENYLTIYRYFFASIGLFLATVYIRYQKEQFAGKIKRYPHLLKKLLIVITAISIPLLPAMERQIRMSFDPSILPKSNADDGHRIEQIVFTSDNRIIAATEYRKEFTVWDLKEGKYVMIRAKGSVYAVASSPDGNYLAVGRSPEEAVRVFDAYDAGIDIWNSSISEKNELRRVESLADEQKQLAVLQVALSPNNVNLAVRRAGTPAVIEIWNLKTGTLDRTISIDGFINLLNGRAMVGKKMVFSPDGKSIAVEGKIVTIWDVNTGECIAGLKSEGDLMPAGVAYSPDGKYLAFAVNKFIGERHKEQGMIEIWDIASHTLVMNLAWEPYTQVETVQYSPDGNYIAAGGGSEYGGMVKVWESNGGTLIKSVRHPDYSVRSLAFSPDGKKIALGGWVHVKVWNWQN